MVYLETQVFIPAISLIQSWNQTICIEAEEHYQKRSFRNRYFLMHQHAPVGLSIPLKSGKNQAMPIQEVLISYDSRWPVEHQRCLQTLYGKSPYFIYYRDAIFDLIQSRTTKLFEFNLRFLEWIIQSAHLPIQISINTNYSKKIPAPDLDFRNSISLKIQNSDFVLTLAEVHPRPLQISILDILFELGPDTAQWLYQQHKKLCNS